VCPASGRRSEQVALDIHAKPIGLRPYRIRDTDSIQQPQRVVQMAARVQLTRPIEQHVGGAHDR
jgi:hypothetical protein